MFYTPAAVAFAVVAVAICGFAFAKGGATERIYASAYVVTWIASLVLQVSAPGSLFPWLILAIDSAMLGLVTILAWRGPSWVTWATAMQALGVACHLMNLFVVSPSVDAFYTVLNLTAYGSLLALAVGTFWSWQERRAASFE